MVVPPHGQADHTRTVCAALTWQRPGEHELDREGAGRANLSRGRGEAVQQSGLDRLEEASNGGVVAAVAGCGWGGESSSLKAKLCELVGGL